MGSVIIFPFLLTIPDLKLDVVIVANPFSSKFVIEYAVRISGDASEMFSRGIGYYIMVL